MSIQTAGDIPIRVTSENSASERRISPSWTIRQLKDKLVLVTGVPALSQKLMLALPGQQAVSIEAVDEENTQLARFSLAPYAELRVDDTRPKGQRENFTDVSKAEKYEMPPEEYEKKTDSVLAWKKKNRLGRFDPSAPSLEEAKLQVHEKEIRARGIEVGQRCRVGGENEKRGEIMYVGEVDEIPGGTGKWVGVRLDEPVGKNDGSLKGKRYWGIDVEGGGARHGVFVRPEKVEVGDWPVLDDFDDMEEI